MPAAARGLVVAFVGYVLVPTAWPTPASRRLSTVAVTRNTRRLLEPIGYGPPAEYEAQDYQA